MQSNELWAEAHTYLLCAIDLWIERAGTTVSALNLTTEHHSF